MLIRLLKAILMSVTYSPLHGTDGDDTLSPNYDVYGDVVDVHTTIYGGGGNDTIKAEEFQLQKSRYAFYGEAGDDTLRYDHKDVQAYFDGGEGNDTIYVTGPLQSADGGANDDIIIVEGKTKHVDGGDGYDTLSASGTTIGEKNVSGFEKLNLWGKVTLDQVSLGSFDKIVVEETAALTLTLQTDLSTVNLETTADSELNLIGSSFADQLDASSYLGNLEIFGGDGDDTIKGSDAGYFGSGGAGNDIVIGGAGKDTLSGGYYSSDEINTVLGDTGNDTINYSGGAGVYDGGEGRDTLTFYSKSSGLHLGAADIKNMEQWDVSYLSGPLYLESFDTSGVQRINGEGRIVLSAQSVLRNIVFDDTVTLTGAETADSISIAKASSDGITINSLGGDDTLTVAAGFARIKGGDGNDTITASAGQIQGDAGNDTLRGSKSAISISGGAGDDQIFGGSRADILAGDAGRDTVMGGAGNDQIKLNATSSKDTDIIDGGAGNDRIYIGNGPHGHGRISGGDGVDTLNGKGSLAGYAVDGVEKLELTGAIKADADTFNGFSKISAYDEWGDSNSFQFTLTSGGKFTWKAASTDVYGSIIGSSEADILDFRKSRDGWNFDLGKGDDIVTGTTSEDTFHFEKGDGHDIINGFNSNFDFIHLVRSSSIKSFDDLEGRILQEGNTVLIVLDKKVASNVADMHDVIELTHVWATDLDASHIKFFDT
jgi:Ca2+-binding RTX toxin-like protein